jgi:hypothetical protein
MDMERIFMREMLARDMILQTSVESATINGYRMNTELSAFDRIHLSGGLAMHPLARPAARLPLSRLLAYPGRPRRRFALKDSGPLWAEAHVASYAADTRPDAPSGASN